MLTTLSQLPKNRKRKIQRKKEEREIVTDSYYEESVVQKQMYA
jgi:hypothetical protein